MDKFNINRFTTRFLAESKRPILTITLGVMGFVVLMVVLYSALFSSSQTQTAAELSVPQGNQNIQKEGQFDPAYSQAVEQANQSNLQAARNDPNGIAIPFVLNETRGDQQASTNTDIETCGCTITSEQFLSLLRQHGVNFDDSIAIEQVADSDLYLNKEKVLVDENNTPHLFFNRIVTLSNSGQLVFEDGSPVTVQNTPVYLSKDGYILDETASQTPLRGSLSSRSGIIILSDGRYAYRSGNMERQADTDIYITRSGQLATLDGRPIRHAGNKVFKNADMELLNQSGAPIRHEDSIVFQNRRGYLVNQQDDVFSTPGILFSYTGIVIDNFGKLKEPLVNMQQIAKSDLFIDDNKNLLDRFSSSVKHFLAPLRVGVGSQIFSIQGPLRNHRESIITINDNGQLSVDVGRGGIRSGWLTNSESVAYDRLGQLISRAGKLSQRGSSDIYLTNDGLLSDVNGRPLAYRTKYLFLDYSNILTNQAIGLQTHDNQPVVDINGENVYLSENGQFVNQQNQLASIGTRITDQDKIVVLSDGSIANLANGYKTALSNDGSALLYNGKPVFVDDQGQLLDENYKPIFDPSSGSPIYLTESGIAVDENGNPLKQGLFSSELATQTLSKLSSLKPVVDENGIQLFHQGKPVYEKSGALIYADGSPVLDENNVPLLFKDGLVVNQDGKNVFSNEKSAFEQVFLDDSPLKIHGESVFVDSDGQLFNARGLPILSEDNQPVFMDNGKLVDKDGNATNISGLEGPILSARSRIIAKPLVTDASGLFTSIDGYLLDEKGRAVTYKGQPVRVNKDGFLVTEDGKLIRSSDRQKLRINENGEIVTEDGSVLSEALLQDGSGAFIYGNGESFDSHIKQIGDSDLYLTRDGFVTDQNGKPILFNGRPVKVDPATGALITDNGRRIRDANGNSVYLTEDGKIVNDNLEQIARLDLATSDGVAISTDGIIVSDLNGVRALGNSGYYVTGDGLIIDREGKPLTQDGEFIYRNSDGQLVTASNKPVRYRSQRLSLTEDGTVIGADGSVIETSDQPLALQQLNSSLEPQNSSSNLTNIVKIPKVKTPAINSITPVKKDTATEQVSPETQVNLVAENQRISDLIPLKNASVEERVRFIKRYDQIKSQMLNQISQITSRTNTGTSVHSEIIVREVPTNTVEASTSDTQQTVSANPNSTILGKAGDSLYAVTTLSFNSDLNNQLEVQIVGLPTKHPLYKAIAYGNVEVRYDNAVFEFNRICPQSLPCTNMQGIGLNVQTGSAGIATKIDRHFWYKTGGLFAASFLKGVGEGIQQTGERTESFTQGTSRTSTTGLDTNDVIISGLGEVGESFIPTFAERANRPITVHVPLGEELVIRLINDLNG